MAYSTVLGVLSDVLPDYELIRDCVAGQRQIKSKGEKYLPRPDPEDCGEAGRLRYNAYVQRAVFYGVTGRTLRGLVGLVFDKDPAIEIPASLEVVRVDATGGGTTLDQLAQKTLGEVVSLGRSGLLTDYPRTAGPTTVQDQNAGNIRPTINRYNAEDIINWRTRTVGAKIMLCLVVIREAYVLEDDGFAHTPGIQYRVLRLTPDNVYTVEIYREVEAPGLPAYDIYTPVNGKGAPFNEIPFTFVGAEDNDPSIDAPPLLDLAELNRAHYCNSADYEESVFFVGQPTPVFAGLTKKWVDEVFTQTVDDGHGSVTRTSAVRLGSRNAVPLPEGGSAELLQAQPNTMAFEAMTHKEDQMIALGAKLIENTGTVQTATEATIDTVLDNSVLGTAARNVSKAIRQCLIWAELYVSGTLIESDEVIDYELSTDFAGRMLSAQDRAEIVKEWQAGALTWDEMRWNLKRSGTAYEDDDKAKESIANDREDTLVFETAAAAALTAAAGKGQPAATE